MLVQADRLWVFRRRSFNKSRKVGTLDGHTGVTNGVVELPESQKTGRVLKYVSANRPLVH
jgi:hypothetical protein